MYRATYVIRKTFAVSPNHPLPQKRFSTIPNVEDDKLSSMKPNSKS